MSRTRLRSVHAALIAIVLLSACNAPIATRSQPPTVAGTSATPTRPGPTATPTGTPSPTSVPPTDTPRPTPTPRPAAALAAARRALANGDFATAIAECQTVLAQAGADPALLATAQFDLGVASLRQGLFAQAAQALRDFLDRYPGDPNAADATFLYAEALRSNEAWPAAIAAYQQYLALETPDANGALPRLLAPYVYDRIGDSLIAQGEYATAVATYTLALDGAPFDLQLAVSEKIAQAYLSLNRFQDAADEYDRLFGTVTAPYLGAKYSYYLAAKYLYLSGAALLAGGDLPSAYDRFQRAVSGYPQAYDAYSSLVVLVDHNVPVDDFDRGRVDYYAGSYEPALTALYRYINDNPVHNGDAHYYAGLSYRALGNPNAAATELTTLIDTHPDAATWGDAWLARAETMADAGNVSGAIRSYMALAERYPQHPQAPESLWEAVILAEQNSDDAAVEQAAAALADGYPADESAPEARLRAGVAAFRLNDLKSAQAQWGQLVAGYGGTSLGAAGLLWLAKTTEDTTAKADLLARAQAADPAGLFGLRAADLAAGRAPFQRPARLVFDYDERAERSAAELWIARYLGVQDDGTLGSLSPTLAGDGRLQRGAMLWRLGLYPEAKAELESLRAAYATDLLSSYELALFFRQIGNYRSSILAARAVLRLAGQYSPAGDYTLQEPRYFARLAFPAYYADLIVPEAEKWDMDPLVILSLISQESVFEGFAQSHAAAQGLMQIIPSTGASIANALDWPDYRNEDLYRPYVNVPFGVYYLAAQRDRFNGDLFAALAAYNAGPVNSADWFERSQGDPDLFYISVTMAEPRLYLQLVYERWAVYKALYGQ